MCLAIIALAVLLATTNFRVFLETMQAWLQQAGGGAPVAFVLIAIIAMSIVLPKTMVSISAGALFGFGSGACMVTIIALSTAVLNYAIGRWILSNKIEGRIQQMKSHGTSWPRALHELASEGGLRFHLLFRFAPIPSMIVNYSMGAAKARFIPFWISALIGVLPQLLWVHSGTLASQNPAEDAATWRWATALLSLVAAIAISILIPRQVMRKIESMD